LNDPRLLGREEFLPDGVDRLESIDRFGLGDIRSKCSHFAHRVGEHFGGAKDIPQLLNDQLLYFACGDSAHFATVSAKFDGVGVDVVAVDLVVSSRSVRPG